MSYLRELQEFLDTCKGKFSVRSKITGGASRPRLWTSLRGRGKEPNHVEQP